MTCFFLFVFSDSGRRGTSLQMSVQSQVWGGDVWEGECCFYHGESLFQHRLWKALKISHVQIVVFGWLSIHIYRPLLCCKVTSMLFECVFWCWRQLYVPSAGRRWPPDRSSSLRTTRWATRWPSPASRIWGNTAAAPTPACPALEKPGCPTCCSVWSLLCIEVITQWTPFNYCHCRTPAEPELPVSDPLGLLQVCQSDSRRLLPAEQ